MPTAVETPPPADKLYTTADLLTMPDDGVERWLIDGRLHEFRGGNGPMTIRNKHHTRLQSRLSHLLESWLDRQPEPRGSVHAGEAGVRLRRDPDQTVGVDLVYLAPELSDRVMGDEETTIIDAVPTLVIEILSPSDTIENVTAKINTFRAGGVPLIWLVDPHFHTVTVHRPGQLPTLLNEAQDLGADPELPGFTVPVSHIFRR